MDALKDVLKTFAVAIVFMMAIATSSGQTKANSDAMVKPCANADWRLAFSDEAKELTKELLKNLGGFSSCEVAVIPFLPDARILRLHTPVDVDYSITATLLRANNEVPLRLVSSWRGMAKRRQPDETGSIAALNFLLDVVKLAPDTEKIKTISELYFFIIDDENDERLLGPIAEHEQQLGKDQSKVSVEIGKQSATATYLDRRWRLTFEFNDGEIRLESVKSTDH